MKVLLISLLFSLSIFGQDEFPKDYKSWNKVNTPLTKIGALPGCDTDVSSLPLIYQETVSTYCSIRPEGPGKVDVLVNPKAASVYQARSKDGKFPDGPNMILHLKELQVLFLTSYKNNQPSYSVFTEDGKNITKPEGSLSKQACIKCHTGYQAFCQNGQCGQSK